MDDSRLEFASLLLLKKLADTSCRQYLLYFDKIELIQREGIPLDQTLVNEFILRYKSNVVRSFMKIYLSFKGITNIEIVKQTGRIAKKKGEIIPKEHLEQLISALYRHNIKYGLMAELSYQCALRRDEVCNINVSDIDWNSWINSENRTGRLLLKKTKGNKQRYVIIPAYLMEIIKAYVLSNDLSLSDKLFFGRDRKTPISKEMYSEINHDISMKLFGKAYKLHSYRRTKATDWHEEGIDIVRIQQRLGHSNIANTRLYVNPDEESELKKWENENK